MNLIPLERGDYGLSCYVKIFKKWSTLRVISIFVNKVFFKQLLHKCSFMVVLLNMAKFYKKAVILDIVINQVIKCWIIDHYKKSNNFKTARWIIFIFLYSESPDSPLSDDTQHMAWEFLLPNRFLKRSVARQKPHISNSFKHVLIVFKQGLGSCKYNWKTFIAWK